MANSKIKTTSILTNNDNQIQDLLILMRNVRKESETGSYLAVNNSTRLRCYLRQLEIRLNKLLEENSQSKKVENKQTGKTENSYVKTAENNYYERRKSCIVKD